MEGPDGVPGDVHGRIVPWAELHWAAGDVWTSRKRELLPEPGGDGRHLQPRQRSEFLGDRERLSTGPVRDHGGPVPEVRGELSREQAGGGGGGSPVDRGERVERGVGRSAAKGQDGSDL